MRPVVLLVLVFLTPFARAATYFVPTDAELIQSADDIVIATAIASHSERTERGGIVTRYTLRIEEVLKGGRTEGAHIVLTERGGRLRGVAQFVSGSPVYEPGERYLVFTSMNARFEPITFGMSLGRFHIRDGLADRGEIHGFDHNLEPHRERPREASRFLDAIRTLRGLREAEYFVATDRVTTEGAIGPTRASYLLEGEYRWQNVPDAGFVISGTLEGSGAAAMRGVDEWNATASNIAYTFTGQDDTAVGGLAEPDGKHGILFGDPNDEIPGSVAASGGAWGGDGYVFEGEAFIAIEEADVVFSDPFIGGPTCLTTVMTHEFGHTLGIRHANRDGAEKACPSSWDCSSDAIMRAAVVCALDGHLRPWDKRAAEVVYGAGPPPPCDEPEITLHSDSVTVRAGMPVTLSASATGTAPVTLQWYIGTPGDRSQPVGSGQAEVVVTPMATTTYWARAGNACGSDISAAVTITVQSNKRRRSVSHS